MVFSELALFVGSETSLVTLDSEVVVPPTLVLTITLVVPSSSSSSSLLGPLEELPLSLLDSDPLDELPP